MAVSPPLKVGFLTYATGVSSSELQALPVHCSAEPFPFPKGVAEG
ncbi:hypothetical protein [Nostoc sp. 106C]|nr:hypothetical protein [Nostoc sp. 106C]